MHRSDDLLTITYLPTYVHTYHGRAHGVESGFKVLQPSIYRDPASSPT